MTPWPHDIADNPVARLAWDLQGRYSFDLPPHLAIEELALEIAEEFDLQVPVSFEVAEAFLKELELSVNVPMTRPLDATHHGNNSGCVQLGAWVVTTRQRDALTRQTLTLFHEFYEILREYLHAFDCAPFPPGMVKKNYVPERMARRFSAAITLPRPYVARFLQDHGLNIPRLIDDSGRSVSCVARRLTELLHEGDILGRATPFLALRCALLPSLLCSDNPRVRCTEHIRSPRFSIRLNRRNGRDYHVPRNREEWKLGKLLRTAMEAGKPVFAHRVTGYDLYGARDLCALAVPEVIEERVVAITVYATLAADFELWKLALPDIKCVELDSVTGLLGAAVKAQRRKTAQGELVDTREALVRGEHRDVSIFRRRRGTAELIEDDSDLYRLEGPPGSSVRLKLGRNGQIRWDPDEDGEEEWTPEAA